MGCTRSPVRIGPARRSAGGKRGTHSAAGVTRFLRNGISRKGKRACFGGRQTGSESLCPDQGHVAQTEERSPEKGQVEDSIASVTTMRM